MENDFERLKAFHERGALRPCGWGDAVEQACMMSALTGATSLEGCTAKGWPKWLAELGTMIFDAAPRGQAFDRAAAFSRAVKAAEDRGAEWDRVFRDFRLATVLPIVLTALGEGKERWRVKCRAAVQWSIDHDGQACPRKMVVAASRAANAVGAGGAIYAAGAAGAFVAAGAVGAVYAAEVAKAGWAEAHTCVFDGITAVLHGDKP